MNDSYTKILPTEEFKESLETKNYNINEEKTMPFNNKQGSMLHILN